MHLSKLCQDIDIQRIVLFYSERFIRAYESVVFVTRSTNHILLATF